MPRAFIIASVMGNDLLDERRIKLGNRKRHARIDQVFSFKTSKDSRIWFKKSLVFSSNNSLISLLGN